MTRDRSERSLLLRFGAFNKVLTLTREARFVERILFLRTKPCQLTATRSTAERRPDDLIRNSELTKRQNWGQHDPRWHKNKVCHWNTDAECGSDQAQDPCFYGLFHSELSTEVLDIHGTCNALITTNDTDRLSNYLGCHDISLQGTRDGVFAANCYARQERFSI